MKIFATVMKILAVVAVIAGIVYTVATYGDRIAAWAKSLWGKYFNCGRCGDDIVHVGDADFEA